MDILEVVNCFLDSRRRGDGTALKPAREKTIFNYCTDLNHFVAFLHARHISDWQEIDRNDVREFVQAVRQKNWRPATQNKIFRSLRTLFNFVASDDLCAAEGLVAYRKQIPRIPRFTPRTYIPPHEDVLNFLNSFRKHTRSGLRNYTVGMLMLDTGMRSGEVRMLTPEHLDLKNRMIHVPEEGKTGWRVVFISNPTVQDLERWLAVRRKFAKCKFLFVTDTGRQMSEMLLNHAWMRQRQRIGLGNGGVGRNLTPHTLRHYFSTSWIREGGNLSKLQAMTGHKTFETLSFYVHLAGDPSVAVEHARVTPRRRLQALNRRRET